MRDFTVKEIAEAAGGRLVCGCGNMIVNNICTDSRIAGPGDLFICLIGEKNDAHKFLPQVIERDCRAVLVSDIEQAKAAIAEISGRGDLGVCSDNCLDGSESASAVRSCGHTAKCEYGCPADMGVAVILVENTTVGLQNLASYYLGTLPLKAKIAVTGSVGKTSTRDMMYAIANSQYKAAKNLKNYNNWFGLPLSILAFPPDTEVCVLEMGMDNFGQIENLARIVRPDIALITNIGISHIENLGSREGILRAKLEVTSFFDENSTLIVNADCDLLSPQSQILRADQEEKHYGLMSAASDGQAASVNQSAASDGDAALGTMNSDSSAALLASATFAPPVADYTISDICDFGDKGIEYTLETLQETVRVRLPLPGAHNAMNASLAIAAASLIGISPAAAAQALEDAKLTEKRLAIKESQGIKVIDDTYNACPASVMSAITTLMNTEGEEKGGRKIAIIGDMYELGQETENGHRQVGEFAAESGLDLLIAVGDFARNYVAGAGGHMPTENILYFPEKAELIECLPEIVHAGDVVLVKASRGMKMEEIVQALTRQE